MNKFKKIAIGGLVASNVVTATIAGQLVMSGAATGTAGTSSDPVVTESYVKAELAKLQNQITSANNKITSLESSVSTLKTTVSKLQSNGTSSGGTTSGSAGSGTTTTKTATVVNASSGLNIRSGPGTNYSKLGSIPNGKTVTVISKSGTWYKIKYGTITGYVSGSYLKLK